MKESFKTTVAKKSTYPTKQNITDATSQKQLFYNNDFDMNITKYKDISFNTYWKDYFAPYHSINCKYLQKNYTTYILNHLGYNPNDGTDMGDTIKNYDYQLFLDNNPQIRENLKQKVAITPITPEIYYNVFVPIFKLYYPTWLGWSIPMMVNDPKNPGSPDPQKYVTKFCSLDLTPLKTNPKYKN